MMKKSALAFLPLGLLAGCRTLGPDYERPEPQVPDAFRGLEAAPGADPEAPTFGDLPWVEAFGDPVLQGLVETALRENHDVRIAAERVLQARSFVTIARADFYPDVVAGGRYEHMRVSENDPFPVPDEESDRWTAFGDLAWELDFWGRFARAAEAARGDLLATEFARRAVIQGLVTELALSYFDLLLLDEQLEITRRTYESRVKSFELVSLRLEQGVANKVEYHQSESLVLQSAGIVPDLEQLIEQQENRIRFLMGGNPSPIPRGHPLLGQNRSVEVPVGLPSGLLERRPDVVQAESGLVAANARIGEAKALLYPTISLTAFGGFASEDLEDLVEGGSGFWSVVPSVTLPIFNAGRLRSNVEVTESQQREAAVRYTQTLQNAFREVADALLALEKRREVRDWAEQLEATLDDQLELSRDRYHGGVTSYLEVLDSERDHFSSELDLVQSIRDELFSYVQLYRALGGGWQGAEELAAGTAGT
ncbi:MAG: efflux transporter outer membrane subunit [Planctomycetota bacterium]|nr:efflux transporter outer membrane subunit [Planctomycetota bacterium]